MPDDIDTFQIRTAIQGDRHASIARLRLRTSTRYHAEKKDALGGWDSARPSCACGGFLPVDTARSRLAMLRVIHCSSMPLMNLWHRPNWHADIYVSLFIHHTLRACEWERCAVHLHRRQRIVLVHGPSQHPGIPFS